MARLRDTTIRDYGGGWNVSDSDLNLNSRYQPISDNVVRGVDGSFSPRMGTSLYADFKDGTEEERYTTLTLKTVGTSPAIEITLTAHGLSSGDHITFWQFASGQGGIPASDINGTHSVVVIDADTFKIFATTAATSNTTQVRGPTAMILDTHTLGGNIIHNRYFNRRLIVFTDIGEVGTVDDNGVIGRIWGAAEAEALSPGLVPTRRCSHWSADAFKSTVIACNGYDKDKPIQIKDDFTVEFLVDKATLSNAAVPKADYVVCMQGYVAFIRTEYGDPFIEFSARGTDGTFTRDSNPADASEVDLSMITSTVESTLLGAAPIRDKLYAAFYDKGMIGTLGVYTDSGQHTPDFTDTVAENGTVSHRTMVSLGNDVFMCDYAGVPSLSISQQSGIFIPVRLSELIAPAIQRHLSNLSEDTLRSKAFAIFNTNDRTYMLFIPVYDPVPVSLMSDPFIFNDDTRAKGWALMRIPGHKLYEDTHVTISGAAGIGDMPSGVINGVKRIVSIVDRDNVIVDLGGAPSNTDDTSGGGSSVVVTPMNDETFVYVFEYNKEFRTRRWTLYRGWNFDCACVSQRGKVFMAKGLKVYRMGDNEIPLYADFIGDYDSRTWNNSTLYPVGHRVKDGSDVYICTVEHTSPVSGTFEEAREAFPDYWTLYEGKPIKWALETPWSDMQDRGKFKINRYINIDSEGYDTFTVSAFVNKIRRKTTTNELMPYRSLNMQAGDSGGWGIQHSGGWGGGRRTREEKVWPMSIRAKLIRWRYEGETTKRVRIISHTMYYMLGNIR